MDASAAGGQLSTGRMGALWDRVYVSGELQEPPVTLGRLPTEQWLHVHMEAAGAFNGHARLMGSIRCPPQPRVLVGIRTRPPRRMDSDPSSARELFSRATSRWIAASPFSG